MGAKTMQVKPSRSRSRSSNERIHTAKDANQVSKVIKKLTEQDESNLAHILSQGRISNISTKSKKKKKESTKLLSPRMQQIDSGLMTDRASTKPQSKQLVDLKRGKNVKPKASGLKTI